VCAWVIQAPDGLVPVISFNQFKTESKYDVFYVYNGIIDTNNLMYQLLGSSLFGEGFPANIIGAISTMTLRFTSDSDNIRTTGVVGTVTFVNRDTIPVLVDNVSRCLHPAFINKSGTIFNTNALNASTYQNGQVCTWVIQAPDGSVPVISFNQFNTEFECDYFYVYNGIIDTNNVMYQLSGSLSTVGFPANIIGASSSTTLRFTSDSFIIMTGVVGTVTFIQK